MESEESFLPVTFPLFLAFPLAATTVVDEEAEELELEAGGAEASALA